MPAELALQGFDFARAYGDPERSRPYLEDTLEFTPRDDGWEARGETARRAVGLRRAPAESGLQGAGTVHHIA